MPIVTEKDRDIVQKSIVGFDLYLCRPALLAMHVYDVPQVILSGLFELTHVRIIAVMVTKSM